MPARAVTDAVTLVCPAATEAGAVMLGVCGAATTVTDALAGALVTLPLLSTHVSVSVPAAPAVKVSVFVEPLVTPDGPPALVMVPPAIVQT